MTFALTFIGGYAAALVCIGWCRFCEGEDGGCREMWRDVTGWYWRWRE